MSRKPIIAANWKMNIGPAEGAQFIESFKNLIKGKDVACDVVIIPPFTTIPSVQNALGGCSCIAAGAQNVSQYDNGAYTGEISTSMLNELNLKYVVLGHSERRQYFGETDAIINSKIKKAIAAGITPHFLHRRNEGRTPGGHFGTRAGNPAQGAASRISPRRRYPTWSSPMNPSGPLAPA